MKIAVITISPDVLRAMIGATARLDAVCPGWGSTEIHYATKAPSPDELRRLADELPGTDAIICDLMGADPRWQEIISGSLDGYRGQLIACSQALIERARLGRFEMAASHRGARGMGAPARQGKPSEDVGRPAMPGLGSKPGGMSGTMPGRTPSGMLGTTPSGMPGRPTDAAPEDLARRDAITYGRLVGAFMTAGEQGALFVLGTLVRDYGGHPELEVSEPPERRAGVRLADPATGTRYARVEDYIAAHDGSAGRPTVALLYYGGSYPVNSEPVAAALNAALSTVCRVLPVAVEMNAAESLGPLRELLTTTGLEPELILNLMSFRLGAGPMGGDPDGGVRLLNDLGAPYIKPLTLSRGTVDDWRESPRGISPSETTVSLLLPELDGCIDEITVAAMSARPAEGGTEPQIGVEQLEMIDEQVDRLVQRVTGMLRLRALANEDKRVAIIGYDYPAGEGNMLGGAFLDTAASIEAIMADLSVQGYRIDPPEPGGLLPDLLSRAVNSPGYVTSGSPIRYSRTDAERDLANPRAWAEVDEYWAARANLPMVDPHGDFLIPAVEYGNVLVGVQPGRGPLSGDTAAHDNTIAPHPQYLAFYTWLRKVWKADVIVHIGTHGTFEFLKAKENAVSVHCFPDLMLEDIPHVYLYYVANPTEGLIARRRAHATIVSYQPPVMRPGGLHGELLELSELLADHRRARDLMPQTTEDLRERLVAQAEAAHLPTDLDELEAELERLAVGLVPRGLHVFGERWGPDEVVEMTCGVVSHGLDDQPPAAELIAANDGLNPAEIDSLSPAQRAQLEDRAAALVNRALTDLGRPVDELATDERLQSLVTRAREVAGRFSSNNEWQGLHDALSGRHIEARLGGDVIRSPQVMPSGASIYQFDPRTIPTPIAMRRGNQIADGLRAAYRESNAGQDLSCAGVVLWGVETSRTQGETYAEVMSLIGVRLREQRRPGRQRWEIIPTAELTAPRADVVVTISGFFRDLFGTLIEELDDMFAAVSALDEPEEINPIAARSRDLRARLVANGLSETDSVELSTARVFGPAPGLYGTGLDAVIEEGQWTTTADLADYFVNAAQHVYARRRHGERVAGFYEAQLSTIEVVSQVRSANEYQITDLDHFFEFLGGVSAAASHASGQQIPSIVADTTGRSVRTETAADAARAGLYTRLLNPDWIESMLAHGHRGVAEISARTTNLLGLAATTAQISDWMFDAVFDRFVADGRMRKRLTDLNPHAAADMNARLTEAHRRGLWAADEGKQRLLDDIQFDIDSDLEGAGD